MGGTHKGVQEGRVEAAHVDRFGPSSCYKEVCYGRRHPQTVNHNELGRHGEAQISHLVSGSTSNMVLRYPSGNGTAKRFGCSNYDIIGITGCSQFSSQYDDGGLKLKRKEPSNSSEERASVQKLLNPTRNIVPGNIPRIQCQNINCGAFPADSKFISSNETCTEVPPTFQFHVSSEEGINLFVDLSSSPSDWIRSLKNKVSISSEVQNSKSGALHYDIKGLGDSDGPMKGSLLGKGSGFQTGGDPISIKSSLVSIVGESLKSTAVPPNSTPVEILGHVENDLMVSSLCEPNSYVLNPTNLSTVSSPRNGEMESLGLEVPNTGQIKSTGSSVMISNSDGTKCLDSSEHQSKSCSIFAENSGATSVGISSGSHKRGLLLPCETHGAIPPIGACLRCSLSGSMETQLSEVGSHYADTSTFLCYNGEPEVNDPVNDTQNEVGGSVSSEFDQNTNLDLLSALPEEQCCYI